MLKNDMADTKATFKSLLPITSMAYYLFIIGQNLIHNFNVHIMPTSDIFFNSIPVTRWVGDNERLCGQWNLACVWLKIFLS